MKSHVPWFKNSLILSPAHSVMHTPSWYCGSCLFYYWNYCFLLFSDDYLVLPSGNLQIISVSTQHQGMYKCGAFNPVTGETVVQPHGTKLLLKRKSDKWFKIQKFSYFSCIFCYRLLTWFFCLDSDSSSPVRIVYPTSPMTVSVQQSQPLTLECIVSGSPAPTANWFKNGKAVTPGPSHQRQHNNLAFVTVMRSDEGSYTCAAETERGTVISANYTVNVLGKKKTRKGIGVWGLFAADLTVIFIFPTLLHRACVYHGGSDQPARLSWLLHSFYLHSERKPFPKHHLAVQRWPHHPIAPLSDLWILTRYYRRDTRGWRRVSVSARQRDWLGTVTWNAYDATRCVPVILNNFLLGYLNSACMSNK